MNFKLVFAAFIAFTAVDLSAQELTLKLSQHPNKEAVIVAVHGLRKDTLGTVPLDQNGIGTLAFKTKHPQTGLVNLTIKGKAYLSYDFVLSPTENPTLICDMEYVYAQNTKILNSPENDCLNRWFDNAAQYKQQIGLNQELSKLYKTEEPFLKKLETEKQRVEKLLQRLADTINQSTLFAGKYMQFKMAQEEKLAKVWESNEAKTIAKNFFTQIDFDALYGSSMWFGIINSCMEVYTKESLYFGTFGADVASNLKRIKNQQVYEDLIDATISVTEKFSWAKDQDAIVAFIIQDNRIKNPTGKLEKIIQSYQLAIGKKSPDLTLTNTVGNNTTTTVLKTNALNSKYTLLLFYQSDCGHCETAIASLKTNYKDLVVKGIKIISIAGDLDPAAFTKTAASFPWAAKYRDVEGMNGVNFKNYGVIGTPTMYMLDSKGMIVSKMATIADVLAFVKKV
ncbi:peroxiredoxin family protein [Flavobacterium sp. GB2R13]|uniref:peroxiredoxin family protein n=1 Tax=Flavobacterium algoris TaxID=3398733 RepID=UPI003A87990F